MLVMPLKALLVAHDRYNAASSLTDVLGDGYLYAHSPLFAKVRDAALGQNFTFVEQESDVWHDYLVMPLLSLKTILLRKSIPYFDNMSVLRRLYQQRPDLELPSRMVYEVLKKNYVFHETCHCVGHSVVESQDNVLDDCRSEKERFVLDALLQEAFANCTERLANVVPGSKTYAFFMNMNSYMNYRQEKHEFWESILAGLGFRRLFAIVFLCFLNLNLQAPGTEIPAERLLEIAWAGPPPNIQDELLKQLIVKEINLSSVFLEETTRGYFRLYDCEPELNLIREAQLIHNDNFAGKLTRLLDELINLVDDRDVIGQPSDPVRLAAV